jgi:DNA-binding IclR family transcriptional regulator
VSELYASTKEPVTLTRVVKESNLPKTTAHRELKQLEASGRLLRGPKNVGFMPLPKVRPAAA